MGGGALYSVGAVDPDIRQARTGKTAPSDAFRATAGTVCHVAQAKRIENGGPVTEPPSILLNFNMTAGRTLALKRRSRPFAVLRGKLSRPGKRTASGAVGVVDCF